MARTGSSATYRHMAPGTTRSTVTPMPEARNPDTRGSETAPGGSGNAFTRTLLPIIEHTIKKPIWDCRMCGQCILHSTGMTCPMTCPKTLRNGPCGGVRENGNCEVIPDMPCIWVKAEHRSRSRLNPHHWENEFHDLHPPVDNQLRGTSSWANLLTRRDKRTPHGWTGSTHEHATSETPGTSLVEVDEPHTLPPGFHTPDHTHH